MYLTCPSWEVWTFTVIGKVLAKGIEGDEDSGSEESFSPCSLHAWIIE